VKDFLGNDLALGDEVVLTAPNYRHFVKAKVIKFTPKKVRVEYLNTWNFPSGNGLRLEYLSDPEFLVKISCS